MASKVRKVRGNMSLAEATGTQTVNRKRGRPKGSKNTKGTKPKKEPKEPKEKLPYMEFNRTTTFVARPGTKTYAKYKANPKYYGPPQPLSEKGMLVLGSASRGKKAEKMYGLESFF